MVNLFRRPIGIYISSRVVVGHMCHVINFAFIAPVTAGPVTDTDRVVHLNLRISQKPKVVLVLTA
jgi:hypothetical protein